VTIVGEVGDHTETTTGTVKFTVKADGDHLQLTPSVDLSTKGKPQAPQGRQKPGRFGPGMMPPAMPKFPGIPGRAKAAPQRELTIDTYGNIFKFTEPTPLPLLLGTAEEFVVEPLSPEGENTWRHERRTALREKDNTNTPAKEVTTYEIAGSSGSTVKIKKIYEFKTVPKAAQATRIQLKGTTEITFDNQAGLITTGKFKGAIAVTQKNANFRIPVTASYRLLTGEEAKNAAAGLTAFSDAEINKAIAEINGGGFNARMAADRLARAIPDDKRRDEVVSALTPLMQDKDGFVRAAAANGLRTWGTAKNVADFVGLLKDENGFARQAAFDALVRLKDAKGAEALAQLMLDNGQRFQAATSLKAMGSAAEKAVLPLLKNSEWAVRLEACRVLVVIGTHESLAALKTAQSDSNAFVTIEATKAVKAIQGR